MLIIISLSRSHLKGDSISTQIKSNLPTNNRALAREYPSCCSFYIKLRNCDPDDEGPRWSMVLITSVAMTHSECLQFVGSSHYACWLNEIVFPQEEQTRTSPATALGGSVNQLNGARNSSCAHLNRWDERVSSQLMAHVRDDSFRILWRFSFKLLPAGYQKIAAYWLVIIVTDNGRLLLECCLELGWPVWKFLLVKHHK